MNDYTQTLPKKLDKIKGKKIELESIKANIVEVGNSIKDLTSKTADILTKIANKRKIEKMNSLQQV